MLLTIIYYVAGATQRNDGRQRNVWRRSVCECCCRNRLQRRHFSLVTNIVAITRMRTWCESSWKFLEAQVISSSLDGWMDGRPMLGPVGWMELCFNHPVVSLPYYSHVALLPVLFVYNRNEPFAAAMAAACYVCQWTSLYRVAWNRCVLYR